MRTIRTLSILFSLLWLTSHAQFDEDSYVEQPSFAVKFAPRIFSPRIAYEKVINSNSSYQFELRGHTLWIPSGIRLEGAYRRYFNDNAPLGPYIQAKLGVGYFDYFFQLLNTNGIQAGGGFLAGGQFNVGSKKALIDVFGGFQWIAPFYLNLERLTPNSQFRNYGYNAIHYLLIATPIEIGVRFGFMGTKTVPRSFESPAGQF